ncbi:MAG: DUF418 domain-containing protein [Firmicutes bacterium]|nr:DUF418 domain-containing protein [Bacillota bacterium]
MQPIQPTPVQPAERISEIDIIRGIALFGILMVNMSFFKIPVMMDRMPSALSPGLDQTVAWLIQLLFTGKFYAIFSFLFGLGFYIFMERTLAKGLELVPLYRRRLVVLLIIGAIHLFLLWSGDILFTYALAGFILLAFRSKNEQQVKRWIIGLFIATLVLQGLFGFVQGFGEVMAGDSYDQMMNELISVAVAVYSTGSFTELFFYRLVNEVPYIIISLFVWIPAVLAFFLCGLYVGRKGIFRDLQGNRPLFIKICTIGFPVGAFFLFLYILFETAVWPVGPTTRIAMLMMTNYLASLFIFPAYVALVLLSLQTDRCRRILAPVASAGRMALTNYLTQTLILITLFYGFGFGLFYKVSLAQGVVITIALYLLQVLWSNLWFKKFKYGPLEWLWRGLTYKKFEPLRYN